MKLLNRIIDKLQETFPPNRIAVLLTPLVFMPAAGAITAWVATHFPGYELSEGLVIGLAAAAALGALQLVNKWLDEWQRGEAINYQGDLEAALDELVDSPDAQNFSLGALRGFSDALDELRQKVVAGSINPDDVGTELESIQIAVVQFLAEHDVDEAPTPPVASPPAEAVPPAAPQPAE